MADKIDRKLRATVDAIANPPTPKRKRAKDDARTRLVERKVKGLVTREHKRQERNAR